MFDQAKMLYEYNMENREPINEKLLKKDEYDIIKNIIKLLKSCERNLFLTVKLVEYEIIDDPYRMEKILHTQEELRKKKGTRKFNSYDNNYMKETDMIGLKVKYYLKVPSTMFMTKEKILVFEEPNYDSKIVDEVKAKSRFSVTGEKVGSWYKRKDTPSGEVGWVHEDYLETDEMYLTNYICIPKIVDKYYFKINNNYYSAMYQVVDSSTYNNTNTTSNKPTTTLRTLFMALRVYRYKMKLNAIGVDEPLNITNYVTGAFSKDVDSELYVFARMGLDVGLKFLLGEHSFRFYDSLEAAKAELDTNEYYIFNKGPVFIGVAKKLLDNSELTQSILCTIINNIKKTTVYEDFHTIEHWLRSLGGFFGKEDETKAQQILESFYQIYDSVTKDSLCLQYEDKADMFCVLRWVLREYNELRLKDNSSLSFKKVRMGEYLASLLAMKISKGIHRIADKGKKARVKDLAKAITVPPTFLIDKINKCNLKNLRNQTNDMDTLIALKYSFKGISGIGGKSNSIKTETRYIHPSHLGRLDIDSSNNTDPGVSGILSPYAELTDEGYFDGISEPNTFRESYIQLINDWKEVKGKKELNDMKKMLGEFQGEEYEKFIDEIITTYRNLVQQVNTSEGIDPFVDIDSVIIPYEQLDKPKD